MLMLRLIPFAAATLLAACAPMKSSDSSSTGGMSQPMSYQSVTAAWPAKTQEVVRKTVAKYGPPQEVSSGRIVWNNNGVWKRTVIYREEVPHSFPVQHPDVMEQFIDYRVPVAKANDLIMYDGSVVAYRTNGELSARCDKEEANFLALNLAHDIATGKRSVEDARAFYAQTMKAMMTSGTMTPYLQGLQFQVPRGGTADPDRPAS